MPQPFDEIRPEAVSVGLGFFVWSRHWGFVEQTRKKSKILTRIKYGERTQQGLSTEA
jgi:hypothetical protein